MNGQARLPRAFWFVIALAIVGGVIAAVSSFTTAADVQAAHKDDVDRNFAGIECTIKLVRMDPSVRAALTDAEVRKLCPILTEAEAHRASTTTTTTSTTARPGAQSSGRTATTRPASTAPAAPAGRSPSTTASQPSPPVSAPQATTQPQPPPTTTTTACPAQLLGRCLLP